MKGAQKTVPGCQRLLAEKMIILRLKMKDIYDEDDDIEWEGQKMMMMMMNIILTMKTLGREASRP